MRAKTDAIQFRHSTQLGACSYHCYTFSLPLYCPRTDRSAQDWRSSGREDDGWRGGRKGRGRGGHDMGGRGGGWRHTNNNLNLHVFVSRDREPRHQHDMRAFVMSARLYSTAGKLSEVMCKRTDCLGLHYTHRSTVAHPLAPQSPNLLFCFMSNRASAPPGHGACRLRMFDRHLRQPPFPLRSQKINPKLRLTQQREPSFASTS